MRRVTISTRSRLVACVETTQLALILRSRPSLVQGSRAHLKFRYGLLPFITRLRWNLYTENFVDDELDVDRVGHTVIVRICGTTENPEYNVNNGLDVHRIDRTIFVDVRWLR